MELGNDSFSNSDTHHSLSPEPDNNPYPSQVLISLAWKFIQIFVLICQKKRFWNSSE